MEVNRSSSLDVLDLNIDNNLYGYIAYLYDIDNNLLSSNIYRLKKDKKYKYQKANIEVTQISDNELEVKSSTFVRGLYLNVYSNDIVFSDNYFDLIPNKAKRVVSSKAIRAEDIELMCVNNL